ncbi:MAG TPA: HAD family hydrolase, partial [Stellaceae bacterium]|nr:HAD family hydrolase [Stellaceae bacterium]
MRRIKLVVSDVDGTLVTRDKKLTPRAVAAVRRLHDSGIAFSIASSRPPFGLRMLIGPLGLRLPLAGYNGGAIVEPDLTVVEQKLIPPEAARRAVALFQENGIDPWVFTGNEWVVVDPEGDKVLREIRTVETHPTVVPRFEERHFAAAGKIVGPSADHAKISRMVDLLRAELGGEVTVARSQPYYCDVTPPGIDKGRLIDLLAARVGAERSQIMVLGDMENDLRMFDRAGFPVAMGNADDKVKRAARATTLSNDEDGFAAAIGRYVFNE